jgi:hypothetical protein
LGGVIDDDYELIGVEAIGAPEDDVAAGHVFGDTEANGSGFAAGRVAVAAGAGVAAWDFLASAGTREGVVFELFEGCGVERVTLGLPDDFFVPFQAVGFESF